MEIAAPSVRNHLLINAYLRTNNEKTLALSCAIAVLVSACFWLYKQLNIDSCLDVGGNWDYSSAVCIGETAFATSPATLATTQTGCVTIPATGLSWELKTDDGGIHDKDNRYRWGGIGVQETRSLCYDDWNSLVTGANDEKLCGFDDWRVPNIDELKTLVSATGEPPLIDTSLFPLTLTEPYWSVSAYAHYPEHAQTVDFANGASNYYQGFRGNSLPVRLVRGGIALP